MSAISSNGKDAARKAAVPKQSAKIATTKSRKANIARLSTLLLSSSDEYFTNSTKTNSAHAKNSPAQRPEYLGNAKMRFLSDHMK